MKNKILLSLVLASMANCPFVAAEPASEPSFTATDSRKIRQLSAMHKRAERFIAQSRIHRAVAVYSEIILMEPDDAVAYTNLGNCYLVLGDFKRAENAFQNALDIDPDNTTAAVGLQSIRDPDSDLHGIVTETPPAATVEAVATPQEAALANPTIPPARQAPLVNLTGELKSQPLKQTTPELIVYGSTPPLKTRNEKIQSALQKAGFYFGAIDGQLGPASRKAIAEFQKQNGLTADGLVGPKTWSSLEKHLEARDRTSS